MSKTMYGGMMTSLCPMMYSLLYMEKLFNNQLTIFYSTCALIRTVTVTIVYCHSAFILSRNQHYNSQKVSFFYLYFIHVAGQSHVFFFSLELINIGQVYCYLHIIIGVDIELYNICGHPNGKQGNVIQCAISCKISPTLRTHSPIVHT